MLLSSQNVASVSSVDFLSFISSSYENYKIVFNSVDCPLASTDSYLMIQLSDNAGSTWQNSGYLNYLGGGVSAGLSCGLLYDGGGALSFNTSGSFDVYNAFSGVGFVSGTGSASFFNNSMLYIGGQQHSGMYNGTPLVVDSLRVMSSDGNPISGNFYLYGY